MADKKELYENYPYLRKAFQYEEAWINQYSDNYSKYIRGSIKVLEVGPGIGSFYFFLQKNYRNIEYHAIDISEDNVKICKERGVTNVICADVMEFLPSLKNEFDLIVANDVLEHFKKNEAIQLIKIFNKSLNDSGTVIARVPNAAYPVSPFHLFNDFTHKTLYTEESLMHLFLLGGFTNLNINTFRFSFPMNGLISILRKFVRFIVLKSHNFLFYILDGEMHKNDMNLYIVARKRNS